MTGVKQRRPRAPKGWEVLATLAIVSAVHGALSVRRRAKLVVELAAIADDWEREDGARELQYASRRFIRPTLALLKTRGR